MRASIPSSALVPSPGFVFEHLFGGVAWHGINNYAYILSHAQPQSDMLCVSMLGQELETRFRWSPWFGFGLFLFVVQTIALRHALPQSIL